MPDLYCDFCGQKFFLTQSEHSKCIPEMDCFCSAKCMLNYIKSYIPKKPKATYWPMRPMLTGDLIFEPKTGTYFRSKYELLVYKWLEENGIEVVYETVFFKDGTKKYVPDFYYPDKDLFIEVKGSWLNGSKKKMKQWKDQVNLLLVPWYLYNSIKKEVEDK